MPQLLQQDKLMPYKIGSNRLQHGGSIQECGKSGFASLSARGGLNRCICVRVLGECGVLATDTNVLGVAETR
jgi:hypothetical protein